MKKNNPHVPILIREGKGVLPRIYARYGELCSPDTWTGPTGLWVCRMSRLTVYRPWEGDDPVVRRYVRCC